MREKESRNFRLGRGTRFYIYQPDNILARSPEVSHPCVLCAWLLLRRLVRVEVIGRVQGGGKTRLRRQIKKNWNTTRERYHVHR